MPIKEKELNFFLFDQLECLDRLEEIANEGDLEKVKREISKEKRFVERKLYQNPSLTNSGT